ncbi:unnamed protein product [Timema podura]|uniref:Uncharacterized protein n=1 Tax=Timema podura TaxID=61482 RepID=A0ABN7NKY9_TIMPD|nr:unnamed protein product [Timema podura]
MYAELQRVLILKHIKELEQDELDNIEDDFGGDNTDDDPDFVETQDPSDTEASECGNEDDNLRKLLQLQSQLGESDFEVIKPGRMVIREGELFKLSRKVMQPRYFILLNDCLLYTSYYGGSMPSSGLKLNYVLSLTGMKVFIPKAEDYQNEFSIISTTRSFMLSARSLEEQKEWVKALKNAIKENESRQLTFKSKTFLNKSLKYNEESPDPFKLGREAPVWIQDHRVTRCQSCTKEFTVTFRRHHCRACGKVVCGSCSDNRAPLEYKNYESARVCSDCYDTLLKEFEESEMIKGSGKQANELYRVRARFKKSEVDTGKKVKYVPQRLLEVTANDTGSQLNGWLQKRTRRSWKRYWFVLKEQVLYAYKASEDVVALESIPVLGYKVVTMNKKRFELYEGVDAKLIFQLEHKGQSPLVFHADNEHMAARSIRNDDVASALKELGVKGDLKAQDRTLGRQLEQLAHGLQCL